MTEQELLVRMERLLTDVFHVGLLVLVFSFVGMILAFIKLAMMARLREAMLAVSRECNSYLLLIQQYYELHEKEGQHVEKAAQVIENMADTIKSGGPLSDSGFHKMPMTSEERARAMERMERSKGK